MNELDIKKIENSLVPPWEAKGLGAEEYAHDLTERWKAINDIVNGRREDTSIVKSTIQDTIEFIVWVSAKKELSSAVALLRAQMIQARSKHEHKITKKGAIEGS